MAKEYGSSRPITSGIVSGSAEFVTVRGQVRTGLSPASIQWTKRVIPFVTLGLAGRGTEVTLGGASEVAIYADHPLVLYIGDSDVPIPWITDLRFSGEIGRLSFRRLSALHFGRLVIFSGYPALGVGFSREDPRMKQPRYVSLAGVNWPLGVDNIQVNTLALPTWAQEAYFMKFIRMTRTAGTIDRLLIRETETGTSQVMYDYSPDAPDSELSLTFEFPYKLGASFEILAYGSIEVAATTLNGTLGLVEI